MLNRIIRFSIHNKLIIGLFTLALVVYGLFEVTRLSVDAVPDITDNQVQVITVSPSLGAPDIERLITFPVEQANSNIAGIKEIRSFSRFGLSLVTIVFDEETDVYWARQQVTERLQQVAGQIPAGAGTPELGPVTTGLGEIYQYVLRPEKGFEDKYGPTELRSIQDWIVRRQLLGVQGVADVSSFGGMLKQYEISVDPDRLKATGVTINDIFQALSNNNANTGGAYIEKGPALLFIRSEGLVASLSDLEDIEVKQSASGTPVMLADVAEIGFGHATRYGTMVYNDEEVAGAVVMMLKGANSNVVIQNVKDRITQIEKTLPKGVKIEPFLDRTKMVNNAISTVKTNLMEGALIIIFVLVLFLGNFRAGLIVASVIPLAMLFAIILMNLFGVSGNLMSLGALDFGLIIDGAVIIVEAVLHHLTHSKTLHHEAQSRSSMNGIVEKTAGRMMNSAVFGQIIILVVYLPVFALSGIEGKMFKPMAQTVVFALAGAFVLSLTYIPMMTALFLGKSAAGGQNFADRWMGKVERFYQHALEKILLRKKWVIGAALALLAFSLIIMSQLGGEFIPELEEGDFAVETRLLTGSNLQTSMKVSKQAAAIIRQNFPEVTKVVAKIGSGEIPTDPMPIEAQDLMIILKDKKDWTSAKTFDELAEKMGEKLGAIPGVSFGFQYPVQMRFNELMTGARQDVVCKIFGENLDSLASLAQRLGKIAGGVDGAVDVYVEPVGGLPQVVIRHNRAAIARYGTSIDEINSVINTAFAGQTAGKVFEGERRYDLVVRLKSDLRTSLDDVADLLIPLKNGDQIPLSLLADVNIQTGPNQIQREDAKRRIIVGFNTRGRDVESIVKELNKKAETQIKLPAGYFITYGGAFENLRAAKKRLGIAVPVSLLLIFILLYFAFGSLRHGLLIYSAIPLSAIGGIIALWLRGMPFSISAGVGFIALFGVAVLNGIVLISEFRRLQADGWTDLRKIVIHGTKIRLRPVLMTAAVASLGFLPMALSHGAGAEVQRPLATVVIGGLLSATLLTLFVLPVIFILFSNRKMKTTGKSAAVILLLLLSSSAAKAQTPIGLLEAVDSAQKYNLTLAATYDELNTRRKLYRTVNAKDPLSVEAEYGQFNSVYFDTRFTASQGFSLPAVYRMKKELMDADNLIFVNNSNIQRYAIQRETVHTWFQLLAYEQKEKLLRESDSLYDVMQQAVARRIATGEAGRMEADYIELLKYESEKQLLQLKNDKNAAQNRFQILLNTDTRFVPDSGKMNELDWAGLDSAFNYRHTDIRDAELQVKSTLLLQRQLKTSRLPNLNLTYNNMSIQGIGADDRAYSTSYRFQSVAVGLSLPVFQSGYKFKQQALQFMEQRDQKLLDARITELEAVWKSLWQNYRLQAKMLEWYALKGRQTANDLRNAALNEFRAGESDLVRLTGLLKQVKDIQLGEIDTRLKYQQALTEIYIFKKI